LSSFICDIFSNISVTKAIYKTHQKILFVKGYFLQRNCMTIPLSRVILTNFVQMLVQIWFYLRSCFAVNGRY